MVKTTRPGGIKEFALTDHLGSTRVTLNETGTALNTTDYEPFGGPLTGVAPRQGYIGKEKDRESNLADHGARKYDYELGRFMSVDPLWEKYRGWSGYNYSLNNPINLIDPTGFDAWEIKNKWNDDYISQFRDFVARQALEEEQSGLHRTCEDFSLQLVIDFAMMNQLPLTIINGSGRFDASSDDYSNVMDFTEAVLSTTGARDLQRQENTTTISSSSLEIGDMLLNRNDGATANHVQVITGMYDQGIGIHQGNTTPLSFTWGWRSIAGTNNPNAKYYGGMSIQSGFIYNSGDYRNFSTGQIYSNFLTAVHAQYVQWNFLRWNQ